MDTAQAFGYDLWNKNEAKSVGVCCTPGIFFCIVFSCQQTQLIVLIYSVFVIMSVDLSIQYYLAIQKLKKRGNLMISFLHREKLVYKFVPDKHLIHLKNGQTHKKRLFPFTKKSFQFHL